MLRHCWLALARAIDLQKYHPLAATLQKRVGVISEPTVTKKLQAG